VLVSLDRVKVSVGELEPTWAVVVMTVGLAELSSDVVSSVVEVSVAVDGDVLVGATPVDSGAVPEEPSVAVTPVLKGIEVGMVEPAEALSGAVVSLSAVDEVEAKPVSVGLEITDGADVSLAVVSGLICAEGCCVVVAGYAVAEADSELATELSDS